MSQTASPACPRCAYDASGACVGWQDQCPVGHTCVECGYQFLWGDLLRASDPRLPGFVEHARGVQFLADACKTLFAALWPGRLWRRVGLHHSPRPGRILLWMLLVFGLWHVINAAFDVLALALNDDMMASIPMSGSAQYWVLASVHCLARPLFWLDSYGSLGAILSGEAGVSVYLLLAGWSPGLLILLIATVVIPFILLLLSRTRLHLRIRPAHVWRPAAYSLAWLAVPLALESILSVINILHVSEFLPYGDESKFVIFLRSIHSHWPVWLVLGLLWLFFSWHAVFRRYWQLSHPAWHAAVVVLVGLLAGLVPASLLFPEDVASLLALDGWTTGRDISGFSIWGEPESW